MDDNYGKKWFVSVVILASHCHIPTVGVPPSIQDKLFVIQCVFNVVFEQRK
jgi:hypothetical protein